MRWQLHVGVDREKLWENSRSNFLSQEARTHANRFDSVALRTRCRSRRLSHGHAHSMALGLQHVHLCWYASANLLRWFASATSSPLDESLQVSFISVPSAFDILAYDARSHTLTRSRESNDEQLIAGMAWCLQGQSKSAVLANRVLMPHARPAGAGPSSSL